MSFLRRSSHCDRHLCYKSSKNRFSTVKLRKAPTQEDAYPKSAIESPSFYEEDISLTGSQWQGQGSRLEGPLAPGANVELKEKIKGGRRYPLPASMDLLGSSNLLEAAANPKSSNALELAREIGHCGIARRISRAESQQETGQQETGWRTGHAKFLNNKI